MTASATSIDWVVLTMGDRPAELAAALDSIGARLGERDRVIVVSNGAGPLTLADGAIADVVVADRNLGIPGGRDLGVRSGHGDVIAFLDDDAVLLGDIERVRTAFDDEPRLAVVSLRLVDAERETAARHVPRVGRSSPSVSGPVTHFLGGACAIRRAAYDAVGGFFTDLHYGHEEIELSWRLIDARWRIGYLADVEVFHPRTDIARHADGWRLTGRNRVWIARRTLPWSIAVAHTLSWLVIGLARSAGARRAYLDGWLTGWSTDWPGSTKRRPISWSGVWRLTRLGRPPVI